MPVTSNVATKCRLCACHLDADDDDDFVSGICSACKDRPETRRIGIRMRGLEAVKTFATHATSAREITPAERALIRKIHGYMPAEQLLAILNERLACDLGPDALPYTMEQLYAAIGDTADVVPAGGHDWASLRKLLAKARRTGALDGINEQVINDFAVVFSLSMKQAMSLRDILLLANQEDDL
ncbi:MAG: hypothetical protein ACYDDA_09480 [Acidiferrobacteraceae bacterium]